MMRPARPSHFILEAFDRHLWCPVVQALLHVTDLEALRAILGETADDDPELQQAYQLDDEELAAVVAKFNVAFDPGQLDCKDLDIHLFRWRRRGVVVLKDVFCEYIGPKDRAG